MKLLLADDHTLFRDALVQYIMRSSPDANITLAQDFNEAMDLMKVDPDQDLVLLDLRMPGMAGIEGFRTMKESYPDVPLALMSGLAEERDVSEAMEIGAQGYFPKTLSGKALLEGIHKVIQGEVFMPTGQDNKPMRAYSPDHSAAQAISLTPREEEVLRFLVQGKSNKEIANALDLQVVTVKLHVRGIFRKMDVSNRTQAAMKAHDLGLV